MRRHVLAALAGIAAASRATGQPADRWSVPAEDAPHARTFLQWPVDRTVYPERWFLDDVQHTIATLANTIAAFEPVVVLAAAEQHAAIRLQVAEAVTLWDIPTDDLWARDSGPLFVVNGTGGLAIRHVNFDGWGGRQRHPNDA